jgi:hypothetical protein
MGWLGGGKLGVLYKWFYTNWFIADASEAEAIASTAKTGERSLEDWKNLSIKNIGEIGLSALWAILRGELDTLQSVTGDLLL